MIGRVRTVQLAAVLACAGCASMFEELPGEPPPLADLEEPLALAEEPKDEDARRALPPGGFTGVYVADARRSLDSMEADSPGIRVARVVENSPGEAAGIEEGDLLVEAVDAAGLRRGLAWPSQWRDVEISAPPGSTLRVVVDRAGVEREVALVVAARVRPPERHESATLREEEKVGVVLRTATEVEARAAGLGPGGGAVVVGLSGASPWRAAGLRFGDVIVSVGGAEVAHPQVVLDAIRDAEAGSALRLDVVRGGARAVVEAPVSRRAEEMRQVGIPLVFDWEQDRGETEWSALVGLVKYHSTAAAWELRLLWLFTLAGGVADRLEEVDR